MMERKAASCEVTKQLVADIKARAPSTLRELFDTITEEGQKFHASAAECERRGIPFIPFKRTKKEDKSNDSKKSRQEGGGGSGIEKRTRCNSCGKYQLGTCDPSRASEAREEVTSHLPHRLRQQVQRHIPLAGTTSTRAKMEARKNVSYLPYYIPIMILKFYSKKLI